MHRVRIASASIPLIHCPEKMPSSPTRSKSSPLSRPLFLSCSTGVQKARHQRDGENRSRRSPLSSGLTPTMSAALTISQASAAPGWGSRDDHSQLDSGAQLPRRRTGEPAVGRPPAFQVPTGRAALPAVPHTIVDDVDSISATTITSDTEALLERAVVQQEPEEWQSDGDDDPVAKRTRAIARLKDSRGPCLPKVPVMPARTSARSTVARRHLRQRRYPAVYAPTFTAPYSV